MVSTNAQGATCCATGGQLDDGLHDTAGAVNAPAVYIIYTLEVIHVPDHYGVYILNLHSSIEQSTLYSLVDELLAVNIRSVALVECLPGSYYGYSPLPHDRLLLVLPENPHTVGLPAESIHTLSKGELDAINLIVPGIPSNLFDSLGHSDQPCGYDRMS